jgi:antitoxin PrlF
LTTGTLSTVSNELGVGKEFPYLLTVIRSGEGMITSKLTSKAQTTIPAPVRTALRLKAGDELVYNVEGDRVILTKGDRRPLDDPFATFDEWSSEADQQAYADL